MADEFLPPAVKSLADAGWDLQDGTAGTGIANDATLNIMEGSQVIDQDLDRSGETTTGISYLRVGPGFTGSLGAPGSPAIIEFNATTGHFYWDSPGKAYLSVGGVTCAKVTVKRGQVFLVAGTFTEIIRDGGEVEIAAGVAYTNLRSVRGKTTDVGTTGTQPDVITIDGGTFIGGRAPNTFTQSAGIAVIDSRTHDFDTLLALNGTGYLTLKGGDAPTATGARGATLDLTQNTIPITIGGTSFKNRGLAVPGRGRPGITISNETADATDDPPAP